MLPDLYLIWKTQRQMVADIFALYGRTAELTRTHMLYCLFRHAASQVLRDVVVRTGAALIVQQLSSSALSNVMRKSGYVSLTRGWPAAPPAAGFRWPARPRSAPTRTGTRCRSRRRAQRLLMRLPAGPPSDKA